MRLAEKRLEFFQVHAGAKRFAGASEDDNLRRRLLNIVERRHQFLNQLKTDRVPLLRTVERDDGYARLECELESAIAHLSNCATDFTDHTDVCVSLWPC